MTFTGYSTPHRKAGATVAFAYQITDANNNQ